MLDPLPVDVAGPTNWAPAVDDLNGWSAAVLVVAQAFTIVLVIWGGAEAVRRSLLRRRA